VGVAESPRKGPAGVHVRVAKLGNREPAPDSGKAGEGARESRRSAAARVQRGGAVLTRRRRRGTMAYLCLGGRAEQAYDHGNGQRFTDHRPSPFPATGERVGAEADPHGLNLLIEPWIINLHGARSFPTYGRSLETRVERHR